MSEPILTVWVIYQSPRDYPGQYVLRRHTTYRDGRVVPAQDASLVAYDLEACRRRCQNLGLAQLARHPDDDPVILETWI